MSTLLRILAGCGGFLLVIGVLGSAVRTLLLPRGLPSRIARLVFVSTWKSFGLALGKNADYERRDRVYAYLGPVYLLVLIGWWLFLVWVAFAGMLWAILFHRSGNVFVTSASSLTTLGFARPPGSGPALFSALESIVGLGLLALLISYLPTLYSAFSRRESAVNKLSMRGGNPPTGMGLIAWSWRFDRFSDLPPLWRYWEDWFGELGETHTSFPVLVSFRSPRMGQSWITASGAVLDAAALRCSVADAPRDIDAELCIRAGTLALRTIADYQGIQYDSDPKADDPITLVREDFDLACESFEAASVPLHEDRDSAWRDFSGWRVNYDRVLVTLATTTMAPFAPWSSDRSVSRFQRPPLLFWRLQPRGTQRPWT